MLITTAADNIVICQFENVFRENKAKHFIGIICPADDSHKTPSLTFSKIYNDKNESNNIR